MYFKCETTDITAPQMAAVNAIDNLYRDQNMVCTVVSLAPLTFDLKPQLSPQMRKRLILDRIPNVLPGYVAATTQDNTLVISPIEGADASKRTRKRAS